MTYAEFVKMYIDPAKITDDAAREGVYYSRSAFCSLDHQHRVAVALVLHIAKAAVDANNQIPLDPESLIWVKTTLSALAMAVLEQGRTRHNPGPSEMLMRSELPWILAAHCEFVDSQSDFDPSLN